ncbi:MAG: hypothetical protein HKP58_02080 [Desulfatitalea sp.]|nr:hypothetical protein [Desulfatitalea sp.]NNJ99177.1 hypothetical protein [Desulfatitalea sp.]
MRKKCYESFSVTGVANGLIFVIAMTVVISALSSCGPARQPQQMEYQDSKEDLFSVSFPTQKNGWACGRWGTVLHTTDGGIKWVNQDSGTDCTLSSIFFKDPIHGWAVGNSGTIIHTSDGGNTWEKQKSPIPFRHMKVFFVTPLKGWIASERTHILATVDGGRTWQLQFADDDFILKSISFCDELNGWAVGEYGYIYRTQDGGTTWEKQAGYFGFSKNSGTVVGDPFLFDVAAIDPQTAWAVGIDGQVIRTINGGASWVKVNAGASMTPFFCVAANPEGAIAIGGNGTFLISTDKGVSWEKPVFDPPVDYGWIYGLTGRGGSQFAAVGWHGSIYLSEGDHSLNSWHRVNM